MAAPPEKRAWYITPRPLEEHGFPHPKTAARNAAVASRLHGAIEKTHRDSRQFYVTVQGQPTDLNSFDEKLRALDIGSVQLQAPPDDAYILEYVGLGLVHIEATHSALRGGAQSSGNPHPPSVSVPDSLHSSVRSFVAAEKARQELSRERELRMLEAARADTEAARAATLEAENARLQAALEAARALCNRRFRVGRPVCQPRWLRASLGGRDASAQCYREPRAAWAQPVSKLLRRREKGHSS